MHIKEKKQALLILAAVGMVAFFWLLVFMPQRRELRSLSEKREAAAAKREDALAKSGELGGLFAKRAKLEGEIGDFEKRVPGSSEFGGFIQEMTNLMNEHGLSNQSIQPGNLIKEKEFSCIPVEMHCRGGLKEMFLFFDGIEKLSRLVRIGEFRLKSDEEFSGEVTLEAKAYIYFGAGGEQG